MFHLPWVLNRISVKGLTLVYSFCPATQLADRINRIAASLSRPDKLAVLLQVNTSGEETKYGCEPAEVVEIAQHIAQKCEALQLAGLMTIGMPDYSSKPENFSGLVECRWVEHRGLHMICCGVAGACKTGSAIWNQTFAAGALQHLHGYQ